LPAFARIVGSDVERENCRGVADSVDLMHIGKDACRRQHCKDWTASTLDLKFG
jgi:hypothetical protein